MEKECYSVTFLSENRANYIQIKIGSSCFVRLSKRAVYLRQSPKGGPLATLAGRGQLGGWTQKSSGSKAGFKLEPPLSPSAHIAPILAPFVIPVSLIPVIPATPLISVNLKGAAPPPSRARRRKIWKVEKKKYRVPECSNYEPRTLPSSIGWHVEGLSHQQKDLVSQKLICASFTDLTYNTVTKIQYSDFASTHHTQIHTLQLWRKGGEEGS